MAQGHHHPIDADSNDAKVTLAIALNIGLTLPQIIGRLNAGRLSLIAETQR